MYRNNYLQRPSTKILVQEEEEIDKRLKLNDIIPEDMAQSLVRQGLLEYFEGHFEYLTD